MEFVIRRAAPFVHSGEKWKARTKIKIWDASQDRQPKIQSSSVGEVFKELWSRLTTIADFRSSFRQISHTSNVRLLEDKIQDRDAKIASALNKIIHNSHFKKENQSWGTKKPRKRTVSFVEERSLNWSTNNFWSLEPMILSKTTPTCSPFFFEMTIFRNSILSGTEYCCLRRKSHMMTSWKDCTN